jgi:hypothetical protein
MRLGCGGVIIMAHETALTAPPPGVRARDIDLLRFSVASPFNHPVYRSLCEDLAGSDGSTLVAEAWHQLKAPEAAPGVYRMVPLYGPQASYQTLLRFLSNKRCPAPRYLAEGLYEVGVRNLDDLRHLVEAGWSIQKEWLETNCPMAGRDLEGGIGLAYTSARDHVVSDLKVSLKDILQRKAITGQATWLRIESGMTGDTPWVPWADPLSVILANEETNLRSALLAEMAMTEAEERHRDRESALKTLIIDAELVTGRLKDVIESISRLGRKFNCTCLILADQSVPSVVEPHIGFIVEVGDTVTISMDGEKVDIGDLVDHQHLQQAHAMLYRKDET